MGGSGRHLKKKIANESNESRASIFLRKVEARTIHIGDIYPPPPPSVLAEALETVLSRQTATTTTEAPITFPAGMPVEVRDLVQNLMRHDLKLANAAVDYWTMVDAAHIASNALNSKTSDIMQTKGEIDAADSNTLGSIFSEKNLIEWRVMSVRLELVSQVERANKDLAHARDVIASALLKGDRKTVRDLSSTFRLNRPGFAGGHFV